MLADQILKPVDGLGLGNVELHRGLADVEVDLAGSASHVTKIRIRHFARAVHDATHHRDLHALQVLGGSLDLGRGALQVEKRPAAGRTGHIIRFEDPATRRLQDVEAETQTGPWSRFSPHQNGIPDAVAKQRPNMNRGAN